MSIFQPRQPVLHKGRNATVVHRCADRSPTGADRYVVSVINAKGRMTTVVALSTSLQPRKEPTMTYPVTNDTEVELVNHDGSIEFWTGPFADFCASNKFEDDEIAKIETGLHEDGEFIGGVGGGGIYTLKLSAVEP